MQTVSKDEFAQWKDSPVTREVFEIVRNRIEDAKEILAISAGNEPLDDRLLVGMIKAFNEVLDISYEE